MKRFKQRIWSGSVLEQIIFSAPESVPANKAKVKKPRFETQEEREKFNEGISLRKFIRMVNATFTPQSFYSTLTFDLENEIHTVKECKRERDNYYRRLIRKYPDAKIVIVYGRGKNTNRFHLHAITDGIPKDELGKLWGRGSVVEIKNLRRNNTYINSNGIKVDHGTDYTGLATYLFYHWQKEFGGHRYKASRTCSAPEKEIPTEAIREYSEEHPPIAPKGYMLVETRKNKYGFQYFKYVSVIDEPCKCVKFYDRTQKRRKKWKNSSLKGLKD